MKKKKKKLSLPFYYVLSGVSLLRLLIYVQHVQNCQSIQFSLPTFFYFSFVRSAVCTYVAVKVWHNGKYVLYINTSLKLPLHQ